MTLRIKIDDVFYSILDGTLEIQLAKGAAGCSLNCEIPSWSGLPRLKGEVEFDGLGIVFNGRVTALPDDPKPGVTTYKIGCQGPQLYLRGQQAEYAARNKTVSEIGADLMFGRTIPVSVGVGEGADIELVGFAFSGDLGAAFENLAKRAGLEYWIAPNGAINFIDPAHRPAAPFNWRVGVDSGFGEMSRQFSLELPNNQVIVTGGVKPVPGGPDDEEILEFSEKSDGSKVWFDLIEEMDSLEEFTVDGDALEVIEYTLTGWEDAPAVYYPKLHPPKVKLKEAAPEGQEISWKLKIQYAQATADDAAGQADFGQVFTKSVSMPEIRTKNEAQQAAESLLKLEGLPQISVSAQVPASPSIFYPCAEVHTVDSRRPGFDYHLGVATNRLRQAKGREGWTQEVQLGNDGPGNGVGGFEGLGNLLGPAIKKATKPQTKQPPTNNTSPAAASPLLNGPTCIAFDPDGNLYFSDSGNARIRKISGAGILSTYAGNGTEGYSGDGGPATAATVYGHFLLTDMQADATHLYFCGLTDGSVDTSLWHTAIRRVEFASGNIELFAGSYVAGDSGDGGAVTSAELDYPRGLGLAGSDVFVSTGSAFFDANGNIRKISGGTITRIVDDFVFFSQCLYDGADIVGSDYYGSKLVKYAPDGTGPTDLCTGVTYPQGIAFDPDSGDYFTLNYDSGNSVYKIVRVTSGGTVTHFAGADTYGYSGDGGPAVDAQFRFPSAPPIGLVVKDGFLYVSDTQNHCIRKIDLTSGIITLVAGTPESFGFDGDGGPAIP